MGDSILIVDMGFRSDQLRSLHNRIHQDGYQCVVVKTFDGLTDAVSNLHYKLILVGAGNNDLLPLHLQLQDFAQGGHQVPILLCFTDDLRGDDHKLLALDIDDFSFAPVNVNDILLRLRRLLRRREAEQGETERTEQAFIEHSSLRQVIGQSPAFTEVKKQITRLAACDVTILLMGETGTGKEMCARAIHSLSHRAKGPFIPVNCSAIPTELFENELFGHEPGAYTDARQRRKGLIAEAEGGTLFLDEVDSLHPLAQVKLLRFLQDRQYKPLGASTYKQANVRLLAATNQDLKSKVKEGSFREDLYFRIKIVSVQLPPLRERVADIQSLATHFLSVATTEYGMPTMHFSTDAVRKLSHYSWPGNVRELENMIRQTVVLAEGTTINPKDLNLPSESQKKSGSSEESFNEAKARVIETFERSYLQQVLSASGGNISQAARFAQKDRRTFFGLLKKHGLLQLNASLCRSQAF